MRWTDLPRDREPGGEQDRPVVARGEWEDLRQRLERLPPGHPSSPDDGDAAQADADRTEDGPGGERSREQGGADQCGDRSTERGGRAGPDGRAEPGRYHAGLSRGPDQREPYQPWFASGDWPDPWFSVDPDGDVL